MPATHLHSLTKMLAQHDSRSATLPPHVQRAGGRVPGSPAQRALVEAPRSARRRPWHSTGRAHVSGQRSRPLRLAPHFTAAHNASRLFIDIR